MRTFIGIPGSRVVPSQARSRPGRTEGRAWLLLVFVGWTAYAFVLMYQSALWSWAGGRLPQVWYGPLVYAFGVVWTWAALTPLVVWLARRFPFHRGRRSMAAAVHVPAALCVTVLVVAVEYLIARLLPGAGDNFVFTYVQRFDASVFFYAGTVAVTHAIDYARAVRAERIRVAEMQTRLAEARLARLESQIRPHFLFNTLNTISAMIGRDPEAADTMVAQLGDLLRMSLDGSIAAETTLERELESARLYAGIEQQRFEDWLRFEVRADPDTLDAAVPPFILQPLIENAIRHGIAPSRRPGSVTVETRTRDGDLEIVVSDDGVGYAEAAGTAGSGIGLSSIRARLAHAYGDRQSLHIAAVPGAGTRVCIRIPLRHVSVAAPVSFAG